MAIFSKASVYQPHDSCLNLMLSKTIFKFLYMRVTSEGRETAIFDKLVSSIGHLLSGNLQQRAKQTDFLPSYDVKLVVFKKLWGLFDCCHALGMNIY